MLLPTDQHGRMTTGGGQNGNVAIAGATSEAFTRWLHHQYAPSLLSPLNCLCRGISFYSVILCSFLSWVGHKTLIKWRLVKTKL